MSAPDERCSSCTLANALGRRLRSTAEDDGALEVDCWANEIVMIDKARAKNARCRFGCVRSANFFTRTKIADNSAQGQPVARLRQRSRAVEREICVLLQEPL